MGGGNGSAKHPPTGPRMHPLHNHGQSAKLTGYPWLNKPISPLSGNTCLNGAHNTHTKHVFFLGGGLPCVLLLL